MMLQTKDILSKERQNALAPAASAAEATSGASSDYSSTNVQVQGVDEADIVKTRRAIYLSS